MEEWRLWVDTSECGARMRLAWCVKAQGAYELVICDLFVILVCLPVSCVHSLCVRRTSGAPLVSLVGGWLWFAGLLPLPNDLQFSPVELSR
jgi:hypothetical protein